MQGIWNVAFAFLIGTATSEQVTVSSRVAAIVDAVHNISIPGEGRRAGEASGRHMMIERLLKTVVATEKLTPTQIDVFRNVSTLLKAILLDLKGERDQDQVELDKITENLASCVGVGVVEDTALEANVTTSGQTHLDCRGEEEVLFDDDAAKCGSLSTFLHALDNLNCELPQVELSKIDEWADLIDDGHSWFTTNVVEYESLRDPCQLATSVLAAKIQECNVDQVSYETRFCEWHLHRTERCATLITCYDDHVASHQVEVNRVRPVANKRVAMARVITFVTCLVDEMLVGNTDMTACDHEKDNDYSAYNNIFPDLDAREPCSTTEVQTYPGLAAWNEFAYSGVSAKSPFVEDTGVRCIAQR